MSKQYKLFESNEFTSPKTYRAIRHDIVREKQNKNDQSVHHPLQKINQIKRILQGKTELNILELFSGRGNCTTEYKKYGIVTCYDKKHLKTGDSFLEYHRLIADKKTFDVIDIDPYGFPNRFFPDIFLLLKHGFIFITMPKPFVNIMNGITKTHLTTYFGEPNPSLDIIIEKIVLFGLCHWRKLELIDSIDCNSIWRFCFKVERVKATEYTGVKNR